MAADPLWGPAVGPGHEVPGQRRELLQAAAMRARAELSWGLTVVLSSGLWGRWRLAAGQLPLAFGLTMSRGAQAPRGRLLLPRPALPSVGHPGRGRLQRTLICWDCHTVTWMRIK